MKYPKWNTSYNFIRSKFLRSSRFFSPVYKNTKPRKNLQYNNHNGRVSFQYWWNFKLVSQNTRNISIKNVKRVETCSRATVFRLRDSVHHGPWKFSAISKSRKYRSLATRLFDRHYKCTGYWISNDLGGFSDPFVQLFVAVSRTWFCNLQIRRRKPTSNDGSWPFESIEFD